MPCPTDNDTKLNRLLRWRNGETPGPWQVVAFPTNRCNLKCSICWQRWVEEKWGKIDHSRELPDERWLRLVDEAAAMGVREWSIGGGGEPMVRGDLVMRMCGRIRELNMNGGLFTNGALLTRKHLEHLVDIGWDRLDLSLDGPTAEINDAIRSKGSFDRVLECMRLLDEIRKERQKTFPLINVHVVLTRLNVDKMDDMVRFVHSFGVRELGFSLLHVQSGQCAELQLSNQQWNRLPQLAQEAYDLGKSLGVDASAWTISEAMKRREARASQPPACHADLFLSAGCFEPFLTATVLSEGNVGPCCVFWDESADNLGQASLQEIWTNPWFQRIRERLLAVDYPDFCAYCPSHFVWQTEEIRTGLRHAVRVREKGLARLLDASTARFFFSSLRQHGLAYTFRRGTEWLGKSLFPKPGHNK